MVEVLQGYAKQFRIGVLPKHLDQLDRKRQAPTARRPTKPRFVHKVSQRLSANIVQQLLHGYEAGQSTRQLMATYSLGKGAVLRLLDGAGIEVRHQGLSPDGQADAARLYATGLSAAKVGARLGCTADAVLAYARMAGVPIWVYGGGRKPKSAS